MKTRTAALVVMVSLTLVIAGGCSKKKSDSSSTTSEPGTTVVATTAKPTTTSTSTSESTTSTTSTTVPVTPTTLPTTPEGFAQALLEAWQQGNHAAALVVATPEAVDQLFAKAPGAYTLQECSGAAGSIICTFTGSSGGLTVQVRNITGGEPMLVVGVQFT